MITKSDWQAARQQMLDEERNRLGDPPTADEMIAYRDDKLSPEDEARVRALLVCYPELALAVAASREETDVEPGDDGYLPEAEVSRRWASLQSRLDRGPAIPDRRVVQFPTTWFAAAAALALVFGVLFWNAESRVRRLTRELSQPHVVPMPQELYPGGARGPSGLTSLTPQGDRYVLDLKLVAVPLFTGYRIEIRNTANPSRVLWKTTMLERSSEESFVVVVPRRFLPPGRYEILVYGVDGREELLHEYRVEVAER